MEFNLKGTIYKSFQIGSAGPTIHQSTLVPTVDDGIDGDLWIVHENSNSGLYQKAGGNWAAITNLSLSGLSNVNIGDNNFIVGQNGLEWVSKDGDDARTSMGVGPLDFPRFAGLSSSDNSGFAVTVNVSTNSTLSIGNDLNVSGSSTIDQDVSTSGSPEFASSVIGTPSGGDFGTGSLNAESLYVDGVPVLTGSLTLDDLSNTVISTPINKQYLKYDGTNWVNSSIVINDVNDFLTTSFTSGDTLVYDGTNFTNSQIGSDSGIQGWSDNLDQLGGLSQGTNNFIVSDGTTWDSLPPFNARTSLDVAQKVSSSTPNGIVIFDGSTGEQKNSLATVGGDGSINSFRAIITKSSDTITLDLSDRNTYTRLTSSNPVTITVPLNADVAFLIGDEIEFFRATAQTVSFVADGGVIINSKSGFLSIAAQYTAVFLKKVGTNEWDLLGNLST